MTVLVIVLYVCLLALMVFRVVIDIKNHREVKSMTLELFEERLKEIRASRSGVALVDFFKRNAVFVNENKAAVKKILARVFSEAADSNKKE